MVKKVMALEEEMEIKVGSEWVNGVGETFTILAKDDGHCFVKFCDGDPKIFLEESIIKFCKPKPTRRTVWLNVYEQDVIFHTDKNNADLRKGTGLLWQQEVELIDPREGGEE